MAKNDYWVIVFKLLTYYYSMMKKGEPINENEISASKFGISIPYLMDIYRNLFDDGYLTGSYVREDYGLPPEINDFESVRITSKGIEYLEDNSRMKKIYATLKELKEWVPGL